jgi:hypothetical protein
MGEREQNRSWALGTLIYEGVDLRKRGKTDLFDLFLSLHHPNNRFENTPIFYLPPFNSVAKKTILR